MTKRGFTLIELLVVIAIIGILSSVVLASLNTARAKSRDAKVESDMHQLQVALQLYYDQTGHMPANPNVGIGTQICDTDSRFLQDLVTSGFMGSVPKSPNSAHYCYYDYGAGPTGALLVAQLEAAPDSTLGYGGTCRPWSSSTNNWCKQTPNKYYCVCNPY